MNSLSPTSRELDEIYRRQVDRVYRVCYLHMKRAADAEDMTQAAFVRLMEAAPAFENEEHEKAWLLRTAINLCRNQQKHWWHMTVGLDQIAEPAAEPFEPDETLARVLALPPKYRTALYLHYYEGYSTAEMARLLRKNAATVRGHLMTGRKMLKMDMEGELRVP